MTVSIREASDLDLEDVLAVERAAFGKEEEAQLAWNLLKDDSAKPYLSLLALKGEQAIGHVLFTRARLEPEANLSVSLLAPLAIIPKFQKQGVGGRLVRHGLEALSKRGTQLVFVLGDPNYYSRHGFEPAGRLGFKATYDLSEEYENAWLVQAFGPDIMGKFKGKVICADALNKPEYWRE